MNKDLVDVLLNPYIPSTTPSVKESRAALRSRYQRLLETKDMANIINGSMVKPYGRKMSVDSINQWFKSAVSPELLDALILMETDENDEFNTPHNIPQAPYDRRDCIENIGPNTSTTTLHPSLSCVNKSIAITHTYGPTTPISNSDPSTKSLRRLVKIKRRKKYRGQHKSNNLKDEKTYPYFQNLKQNSTIPNPQKNFNHLSKNFSRLGNLILRNEILTTTIDVILNNTPISTSSKSINISLTKVLYERKYKDEIGEVKTDKKASIVRWVQSIKDKIHSYHRARNSSLTNISQSLNHYEHNLTKVTKEMWKEMAHTNKFSATSQIQNILTDVRKNGFITTPSFPKHHISLINRSTTVAFTPLTLNSSLDSPKTTKYITNRLYRPSNETQISIAKQSSLTTSFLPSTTSDDVTYTPADLTSTYKPTNAFFKYSTLKLKLLVRKHKVESGSKTGEGSFTNEKEDRLLQEPANKRLNVIIKYLYHNEDLMNHIKRLHGIEKRIKTQLKRLEKLSELSTFTKIPSQTSSLTDVAYLANKSNTHSPGDDLISQITNTTLYDTIAKTSMESINTSLTNQSLFRTDDIIVKNNHRIKLTQIIDRTPTNVTNVSGIYLLANFTGYINSSLKLLQESTAGIVPLNTTYDLFNITSSSERSKKITESSLIFINFTTAANFTSRISSLVSAKPALVNSTHLMSLINISTTQVPQKLYIKEDFVSCNNRIIKLISEEGKSSSTELFLFDLLSARTDFPTPYEINVIDVGKNSKFKRTYTYKSKKVPNKELDLKYNNTRYGDINKRIEEWNRLGIYIVGANPIYKMDNLRFSLEVVFKKAAFVYGIIFGACYNCTLGDRKKIKVPVEITTSVVLSYALSSFDKKWLFVRDSSHNIKIFPNIPNQLIKVFGDYNVSIKALRIYPWNWNLEYIPKIILEGIIGCYCM